MRLFEVEAISDNLDLKVHIAQCLPNLFSRIPRTSLLLSTTLAVHFHLTLKINFSMVLL